MYQEWQWVTPNGVAKTARLCAELEDGRLVTIGSCSWTESESESQVQDTLVEICLQTVPSAGHHPAESGSVPGTTALPSQPEPWATRLRALVSEPLDGRHPTTDQSVYLPGRELGDLRF